MAFEQKTWVDRQSEHPTRRVLTDISTGTKYTVDVERAEGTITTKGDPYSAANMNGFEQRVANAFTQDEQSIATNTQNISNLQTNKQNKLTFDTTPTKGSTNPVTSGGVYTVIGDISSALDKINGESV